ncbi:MAG: YicC/YloC family endoribonuclease [Bacteroidales bacterium]|nr:YicC/YloC family endoribonuclease [Bacteroidales bacterium]
MIQSMTGYGKATATVANKKITAEIRSVNSKQLDLSIKAAPQYREIEMELRAMVQQVAQRGKVDLVLSVEVLAGSTDAPHINQSLLSSYAQQLAEARTSLGLAELSADPTASAIILQTLVRMPEVVCVEAPVVNAEEHQTVKEVVAQALQQFVAFREQEGASLYRVFDAKLANIAAHLESVAPYEKDRTERIRQNLLDRLEKLPVEYDKNRLEQEMIYYIEKLDINEEKTRLTNHLSYFRETMDGELTAGGHGKKLGFIAQEMGREINTLGSKSNQAEMQRIVVMMKDELEQIKEQVLNVL